MHPLHSAASNALRYDQLLAEASHERLLARAAPRRRMPWRHRFAAARRAAGYRLVEAGLHLVVDAR